MSKKNGMNSKILTGWLLLLLFMLPQAAKTVHICQCICFHSADSENEHAHAHHDCNTCAICQFTVFPFTGADSNEFNFTVKIIYSNPFVYIENVNSPVICSYRLRAPPRL
ncbi:MAG: hypothetical protein LBQ01_08480 [Prevotellaceae bacterium]|jgi:hypothetical protein|nr:hypothetical protein [Prevotellaceae bacterium]